MAKWKYFYTKYNNKEFWELMTSDEEPLELSVVKSGPEFIWNVSQLSVGEYGYAEHSIIDSGSEESLDLAIRKCAESAQRTLQKFYDEISLEL